MKPDEVQVGLPIKYLPKAAIITTAKDIQNIRCDNIGFLAEDPIYLNSDVARVNVGKFLEFMNQSNNGFYF